MGVLEWLTPERITSIGIAATSVLTAWMGRLSLRLRAAEAELAQIKSERETDRGVIKAATRYIRDQAVHIAVLCGLLRHHAPEIEIPPEPVLPEELREEV